MKLAVIGDACTDTYVYGLCERLSPEGPVPVLNQHCQHSNGGMSLNVFRNLCNMIDGNHHIDFSTPIIISIFIILNNYSPLSGNSSIGYHSLATS